MKTNRLAIMGLFVALMCVSAWMRIPLPTPFGTTFLTFQTAVAILAALLLKPREAFLVMLVYILLGLVGLPVFANPAFAGLGYFASPTFGYLIGFLLGAPLGSAFLNRALPDNFADLNVRGPLKGIEATEESQESGRFNFSQCFMAALVVIMVVFCSGFAYMWGYARWVVGAPVTFASLASVTTAFLWIKDTVLGAVIASIAPRLRAIIE